jgi:transcriptional regulator with XRE-family HTH domain
MILKLRQERERRGWSLVDLTVKTGISSSDLSLIERGCKPAYPGWQRRIAKAFKMSAEDLFQEVDGES